LIVKEVDEPLIEPVPAPNFPPVGSGPDAWTGRAANSATVMAVAGTHAGSVFDRWARECLFDEVWGITCRLQLLLTQRCAGTEERASAVSCDDCMLN
jgi:hypothetical protein